MSRFGVLNVAALLALLVVACSSSTAVSSTTFPSLGDAEPPSPPPLEADKVERGAVVYQQRCASCHGSDLSGHPDWKTPNEDGTLNPPPQNGTGHTWHHSDRLLLEVVRDGAASTLTRMPAFGDVMTDAEIQAVFEYFKSTWGPQERAFQWQMTWQDQQRG